MQNSAGIERSLSFDKCEHKKCKAKTKWLFTSTDCKHFIVQMHSCMNSCWILTWEVVHGTEKCVLFGTKWTLHSRSCQVQCTIIIYKYRGVCQTLLLIRLVRHCGGQGHHSPNRHIFHRVLGILRVWGSSLSPLDLAVPSLHGSYELNQCNLIRHSMKWQFAQHWIS